MGDTSCLAFQAGKLRHFLPWSQRVPQWDEALVAHGGGLLGYVPFLASLPFLSHFPRIPQVFPEITFHINNSSSWNYWGLDCKVPLHANFFQSMQSVHPIHRFDHQQIENNISTFPSAISQSQLPKPGLYLLFLIHGCEGPNVESKAPLTPTVVKGQSRVYF